MVVETRYEAIPQDIVDLAKQAIFDTLAVTIAGSSWEVSPAIAKQVGAWGGAPESPVLVYGHKVPARVHQARAETERDALRSAVQKQADELAEITGRLDAQQQLLTDYRTKLGVAVPAA